MAGVVCVVCFSYARFVHEEVLPAVLRDPHVVAAYPNLQFSSDPDLRAAYGCSSGGAASLTMAWFRPDLFRRVVACVTPDGPSWRAPTPNSHHELPPPLPPPLPRERRCTHTRAAPGLCIMSVRRAAQPPVPLRQV